MNRRTQCMDQLPTGELMYPKGPTGDCWHLSKDRHKERWVEKGLQENLLKGTGIPSCFQPPLPLYPLCLGRQATRCHTSQNMLVLP